MFVVGYLVCSFLTESLNPFKRTPWHQPKYLRRLGLSSWIALTLTPVFLAILDIEKSENKLLVGSLYILTMSALIFLGYYFIESYSSHRVSKRRGKRRPAVVQKPESSETASPPRIQRKRAVSKKTDDIPPIVINAGKTVVRTAARKRIVSKRAVGT